MLSKINEDSFSNAVVINALIGILLFLIMPLVGMVYGLLFPLSAYVIYCLMERVTPAPLSNVWDIKGDTILMRLKGDYEYIYMAAIEDMTVEYIEIKDVKRINVLHGWFEVMPHNFKRFISIKDDKDIEVVAETLSALINQSPLIIDPDVFVNGCALAASFRIQKRTGYRGKPVGINVYAREDKVIRKIRKLECYKGFVIAGNRKKIDKFMENLPRIWAIVNGGLREGYKEGDKVFY